MKPVAARAYFTVSLDLYKYSVIIYLYTRKVDK